MKKTTDTARKLRILVCAHEYPPRCSGIGYVAVNVVNELRNRGHDVTVCAPSGGDLQAGSEWLIKRTGGIGILHYWRAAAHIIRKHEDEFDVIWANNPLFTTKLPKEAERKVVATVHTTYAEYLTTIAHDVSPVLKKYYQYIIRKERQAYKLMRRFKFIITSELTRQELRTLGVADAKDAHLITNGVDTTRFRKASANEKRSLRRELGLPDDATILLNVGRFSHQKAQTLLIRRFSEAATLMKSRKPVLAIIGDGQLRRELETAATAANAEGCDIRILRPVPQETLVKYYRAADYIIMPSTYEGQPLALLEAMACSLVPLLSPIPVFKALVDETKAGKCLEFTHHDASRRLKQAIETKRYGRESDRVASVLQERYAWSAIAKQYEAVFRKKEGAMR